MRTPDPGWRAARRILCVRLDTMGDVLMTTPAIAALRAGGRHITLLTSRAGADIAALVPDVDDVLVYDAPWMKAPSGRGDPGRDFAARASGVDGDRALIRRLAEGRFDAAVVFSVYNQSALPAAMVCHLAGIPLRLAHCRENPYQLLTDWVSDPEPYTVVRHEVRRQLDLVAAVGFTTADQRLRLRIPEPARARVRRLLASADVPLDGWVLLHPGGAEASRRYPPELFADAARLIVETMGHDVVLGGSAEEVPLVEEIRRLMRVPSRSFAGELDLAELCALVESAPLLVGNNGGPAHIAAAVGTKVVDIYALTNPQHAPWSVQNVVLFNDVPCKFCHKSVCPEGHHACLRGVPPSRVASAVRDLLGLHRSGPRPSRAANDGGSA